MEKFLVSKPNTTGAVTVEVPGSKSITNRALLLAALSDGECVLDGVLFSDDSRAFLSCLDALGFDLRIDERLKRVVVTGMGGVIPRKKASIDVRSAGTAARFLTVMLAFAGGEYTLHSSPQMARRPMQPLLSVLRDAGVEIECLEGEGCFPFILRSEGIKKEELTIDTAVSSQFASAVLMGATLCKGGLTVRLTGGRQSGAYIGITLKMLQQFGIRTEIRTDGNTEGYYIPSGQKYALARYSIEPDFSAADYFFAAGALLNRPVTVRGLYFNSMQGDRKFLSVLSDMGATIEENEVGITVCGGGKLRGVSVDMQDFSDQALTLAALAPFASAPVTIDKIGHIRRQECDRIHAMAVNLQAMGVKCEERADGITIFPAAEISPCEIETFSDHRVAMSFAVAGLRSGNLTILNPLCCKKTFERYFDVLGEAFYAEKEEKGEDI